MVKSRINEIKLITSWDNVNSESKNGEFVIKILYEIIFY